MLGIIAPDGETRVTTDVASCPFRNRNISQQHVHREKAGLLEGNSYISMWFLQVAGEGDRERALRMLSG